MEDPKKEEPTVQKFGHIEAKSITIKASEHSPAVNVMATEPTAGVWVSNEKMGSVALVAQNNMAPYFIIWGKGNKYPPLAISTDVDGKLNIQVVDTGDCSHPADHWMQHVKYIGAEELADLAKNHTPEPQ